MPFYQIFHFFVCNGELRIFCVQSPFTICEFISLFSCESGLFSCYRCFYIYQVKGSPGGANLFLRFCAKRNDARHACSVRCASSPPARLALPLPPPLPRIRQNATLHFVAPGSLPLRVRGSLPRCVKICVLSNPGPLSGGAGSARWASAGAGCGSGGALARAPLPPPFGLRLRLPRPAPAPAGCAGCCWYPPLPPHRGGSSPLPPSGGKLIGRNPDAAGSRCGRGKRCCAAAVGAAPRALGW